MVQRGKNETVLTVFILLAFAQSNFVAEAAAQTPAHLAQALQPDNAPAPSAPPQVTPPSEPSPDQGDPNVTPERQAFDRVLVDAAILRNQYDQSKQSRSKIKPSLSAFRSLEIRLKTFVDADPSNTQAHDMMNAMQQAQGEILGPSIAVAAAASRQLYSDELGQRIASLGYEVSTRGRAITTLLIVGPDKMTSAVALDLDRNEKIFDRAKMLQFEEVIFRGKRGGSFNVGQDRFANVGSDNNNVGSDTESAGPKAGESTRRRARGRRAVRIPNLYRFIRRVL